jgi:hypothetical protein
MFVPWAADIEQSGDNILTLNGTAITTEWMEANCQ